MMTLLQKFRSSRQGTAAIEAALLFPILMTMIFGVFDVGRAITANHKMITATQVIADLVARKPSVSDDDIDQALDAGLLAMSPYAATQSDFGIDIVSVKFDQDDNPVVVWRDTLNMTPDDDAVAKSKGLGAENEGAIIVTMRYDYKPIFGGMVISDYWMSETAYARGRRSPVVTHD